VDHDVHDPAALHVFDAAPAKRSLHSCLLALCRSVHEGRNAHNASVDQDYVAVCKKLPVGMITSTRMEASSCSPKEKTALSGRPRFQRLCAARLPTGRSPSRSNSAQRNLSAPIDTSCNRSDAPTPQGQGLLPVLSDLPFDVRINKERKNHNCLGNWLIVSRSRSQPVYNALASSSLEVWSKLKRNVPWESNHDLGKVP
jgi:hypothetical protein